MKQAYEEIIQDIEKKTIKKAYLIDGIESFFIEKLIDKFTKDFFEDKDKEYGLIKLNGKDISYSDIITQSYSTSFFINRHLIIIKDPQNITDIANPKFIDQLKNFFSYEGNNNHIILVSNGYEFSEKSTLYKLLLEYGVCFRSKKLYDNQISKWIDNYLAEKNIKISKEASSLIFRYIGNNVTRISQELDKIIKLLGSDSEINENHIKSIVSQTREYSIYELQSAIARKSIPQSLEIANIIFSSSNQGDLILCIASLYIFFCKTAAIHLKYKCSDREIATAIQVSEFFVDSYIEAYRKYGIQGCCNAISALHQADLKCKGIVSCNMTPLEIITELIIKIL